MDRSVLIAALAERISALSPGHPLRVGIDGIDAAGKTTLAHELARSVRDRGRHVIRASIDGFHRPRAERYIRGPESPEGYFEDSFDLEALVRELLEPLGPGGSGRYRTEVFDFRTDTCLESEERPAARSAVLLFDGVFLAAPRIARYWDYVVFVEIGFKTCVARARDRDASPGEPADDVERRYRARYIPGQEIYLQQCRPSVSADAVVINDDPLEPEIAFRI